MALFTSTKLALLSLSIMAMLKQSRQEGNAIQETGIPAAKRVRNCEHHQKEQTTVFTHGSTTDFHDGGVVMGIHRSLLS